MAGEYYRSAHLEVKLSDRLAIIHGVESSDLVDAHWWHFQPACNFIHDADAGEAVLALPEIEEGHYSGFFVLRWIAFQYFGDEFFVDSIKLKWYGWIICRGISMLGDVALMEVRGSRSSWAGLDARRSAFRCGEGRLR